MTEQSIVAASAAQPSEPSSAALMSLIERAALSADFDVAKLDQLLAVKERWEANEARKAFVAAMAAFKASPPEILKGKRVTFETSKGTTEYEHATLADVCAAATKGLASVGISHRWDVQQEAGQITVTCILTHDHGHSECVRMTSPPDNSGSKNPIQAIASAVTYLQRYTLLAATGLAARDIDDDGRGAGGPIAPITADQVADLRALAEEVGANMPAFLKWLSVERLEDLPASAYRKAIAGLEAKRKA